MGAPRIEVKLPAGWNRRQIAGTLYAAQGPAEQSGAPSFVVSTEPATDAKAFAARQLMELKASLAKLKVVSERESVIGTHKGVLRELTFEMQGKAVGQVHFYLVHGGHAYVLTVTGDTSALAVSKAHLEQLARASTVG